jgi:hypothetical protein
VGRGRSAVAISIALALGQCPDSTARAESAGEQCVRDEFVRRNPSAERTVQRVVAGFEVIAEASSPKCDAFLVIAEEKSGREQTRATYIDSTGRSFSLQVPPTRHPYKLAWDTRRKRVYYESTALRADACRLLDFSSRMMQAVNAASCLPSEDLSHLAYVLDLRQRFGAKDNPLWQETFMIDGKGVLLSSRVLGRRVEIRRWLSPTDVSVCTQAGERQPVLMTCSATAPGCKLVGACAFSN